uniref:Cytochrome c biogenesis protein CcsA n=1 Tax=Laurenciella marilzae TaxID=1413812 RepID=A0A1Z1M0W5_9FLOR|nr:cytochrome c biogenesis protein ccs1 [Laurenciella marilzae]ARW59747.1 cytochrome c biogenesis protein ccs1 [Laurenciella marilzae]
MNLDLIENNLINISFGILLIVLILSWFNLTIKKNKILDNILNLLNLQANLALGSSLLIRWVSNHYFPLSNLYESLIFLAWCLTTIGLIATKKTDNQILPAIISPISLFIVAFINTCLPEDMKAAKPLVPALQSNWLMMHVTVMMLSYAVLIIGSLLSTLFLVISIGKKIKTYGSSYNSSNKIIMEYKSKPIQTRVSRSQIETNYSINLLQAIDNLSYRTIGLGFPLLTVGIISGAVWANEAWGTYWSWDPKETWALITWIIFAVYLHTRINKKLTGYVPSIIGSVGFIIIWLCYLGVNFLAKGLHSYGWILQ